MTDGNWQCLQRKHQQHIGNWTFLEIDDEKVPLKILIPNKIVKEKDCVEFYDWQSSNIPEDKRQTCPWEKKKWLSLLAQASWGLGSNGTVNRLKGTIFS